VDTCRWSPLPQPLPPPANQLARPGLPQLAFWCSPCRYKCGVCEDIDLCGACMRALVAARIKMSQEAAPLAAPHLAQPVRRLSVC
jgi:hypothetical protein